MLRRLITFENPFTQEEVTEEHYFHISKADLVEMEMEEHGDAYTSQAGEKLTGMRAKLQRISDAEDGKAIMRELKEMILRSYGHKVGDRFVKNDDIKKEFASSEAFSQLLYELCTDAAKAGEFTSSIVPSNLEQEAARLVAEAERASEARSTTPSPITPEPEIAAPPIVGASDPSELSNERLAVLSLATPDNPIRLGRSDIVGLPSTKLKDGIASGAFQV